MERRAGWRGEPATAHRPDQRAPRARRRAGEPAAVDPHAFLAIKDRAAEWLFEIPGVHIVGVGAKEIGGRRTGVPSIKIGVLEKRALADIPPRERIPSQIEGLPTDVIAAPRQRLAAVPGAFEELVEADKLVDKSRRRPLRGGCAIVVKGEGGYGTLGLFCGVKNDLSRVFALTAAHVITDDAGNHGNRKIGQPSGKDRCCKSTSDIIGRAHDAEFVDQVVDVGLIKLDGDTKYMREVIDIGMVGDPVELTFADICGDPPFQVQKRGARSGLTGGIVSMGKAFCDAEMANGGTKRLSNIFMVLANHTPDDNPGAVFATQGDSGAAVLSLANEVVGIVATAGPIIIPMAGVVPIGNIFKAYSTDVPVARRLDLEILKPASPGQVFTVPRVALEPDAPVPISEDAIEADLARTRIGTWYGALYRRHRDEIDRLVDSNRHMAAVWHRRGGAGLVQSLGRVLADPARRVPAEIEGRSLAACIEDFARALLRFGTEDLRRDLVAVRPTLPNVAGLSYREILDALDVADRSFTPVASHG